MLWLAGMTPVACLAAWGACLVLRSEQAWLLEDLLAGRFWGLPVFVATLFPQVVFYIPVFWLLLSWALAKERRIRTAGFLILLLVLGMGTGAGSVAKSWFCIITGLTLPILMGLSE